jgi:hypothetical protein
MKIPFLEVMSLDFLLPALAVEDFGAGDEDRTRNFQLGN